MEIHLDGERVEVPAGARLGDLFSGRDEQCSVAVIRPGVEEGAAESQEVRFTTPAGDMIVETSESALVSRPDLAGHLRQHWQ